MLEINLLPVREARRKENIRQQVMQLVLGLILTAAAIGFLNSSISDQLEMAQLRVDQMQRDIEQFQPQIELVAKFKKRKAELEKKIDIIDGLDKARTGPVRLLAELADRTPERLWITKLATKGSTLSIEGKSLDNELVAVFLSELGDSPYFAAVDLNKTEIGRARSGGLKLVSFSITARLVSGDVAAKQAKTPGRA